MIPNSVTGPGSYQIDTLSTTECLVFADIIITRLLSYVVGIWEAVVIPMNKEKVGVNHFPLSNDYNGEATPAPPFVFLLLSIHTWEGKFRHHSFYLGMVKIYAHSVVVVGGIVGSGPWTLRQ